MLSSAIKLRNQAITDAESYAQAAGFRGEIETAMDSPARHMGIRRIQDIFRENKHRLYHWSEGGRVPADDNSAERDLRPSVTARKVSYGSVTDAGARTRSTMTTVGATRRKGGMDAAYQIKSSSDVLASNSEQDAYSLLFSTPHSPASENGAPAP